MLRRLGERGEGSLSYLTVLLLIGSVLAVITVVAIPDKIVAGIKSGVCMVSQEEDCRKPAGEPQAAAPSPAAPTTSGPAAPSPSTTPASTGLSPEDQAYADALAAQAQADKDATSVEDEWANFDLLKEIGAIGLDFLAGDIIACIEKPNFADCAWALVSIVPWGKIGKLLKSIPKIIKLVDKFLDLKRRLDKARKAKKDAKDRVDDALEACKKKPDNSFVSGTPVLMADGSRIPIERVRIGDHVWASDPETGLSGPRKVTDRIVGDGRKQLVDLTIGLDGELGGRTVKLTATTDHPLWVDGVGDWIDAGRLVFGDRLAMPDGRHAVVLGSDRRAKTGRVFNLSVAGIHTYYVGTGAAPILAHNCGPADVVRNYQQIQDRIATHVIPLHGHGGSASGTKFAQNVGEDDILNKLYDNLSDATSTGRRDASGNHEHIFAWPGAGSNGEGYVRVWMTPDGELGGMWPIPSP